MSNTAQRDDDRAQHARPEWTEPRTDVLARVADDALSAARHDVCVRAAPDNDVGARHEPRERYERHVRQEQHERHVRHVRHVRNERNDIHARGTLLAAGREPTQGHTLGSMLGVPWAENTNARVYAPVRQPATPLRTHSTPVLLTRGARGLLAARPANERHQTHETHETHETQEADLTAACPVPAPAAKTDLSPV